MKGTFEIYQNLIGLGTISRMGDASVDRPMLVFRFQDISFSVGPYDMQLRLWITASCLTERKNMFAN
jgi:hypothetical protein